MSNQLVEGSSYNARRNGPIRVYETEKGALMAAIPYITLSVPFEGEHVIVLGAKDGSLQERNIQVLQEHFGWAGEIGEFSPAQAEGGEAEFKLVDWHNESYAKGEEQVDKWVFRWLNRIGNVQTPEQVEATKSKWGKKLAYALGAAPAEKQESKPVETPAEAKKKSPPGRKPAAAKVVYKEAVDVFEAACLKHGGKAQADMSESEQDDIANKHWFPACKKVMGDPDKSPETAEEIAKVAEAVGV